MENKEYRFDAAFKLNGIERAVTKGNRTAARKRWINDDLAWRCRRQRKELSKCKKRRQKSFEEESLSWTWMLAERQKLLFAVCKTFPVGYVFVEFYCYAFKFFKEICVTSFCVNQ